MAPAPTPAEMIPVYHFCGVGHALLLTVLLADSVCVCRAAESTGGSRKGTPPIPLPAAAALAAHLKQGVPQIQHGGLLGVFAAHHAQV